MLHAKFRDPQTSGSKAEDFESVLSIYGHVTKTIFIIFVSSKGFGYDWPSDFREEV